MTWEPQTERLYSPKGDLISISIKRTADGEREQIHPPLQREWKDLTTAEIKTLWNATKKPTEFAELLLAKVKEKNNRDMPGV